MQTVFTKIKQFKRLLIITSLINLPTIFAKPDYNFPSYQYASCNLDYEKTSTEPTPFRFKDVGDNIDIFINPIATYDRYYETKALVKNLNYSYIVSDLSFIESNSTLKLFGIWQTPSDGKREIRGEVRIPYEDNYSFTITVKRILEDTNNPDSPIPPEYEALNKLANRVYNCKLTLEALNEI